MRALTSFTAEKSETRKFRSSLGEGGRHTTDQPNSYPLGYIAVHPSGPGQGLAQYRANSVVQTDWQERGLRQQGEKWPPSFPVLHILTSQEPPITNSLEATLEQDSTRSSWSPGPKPGNSSTRPCRPEIHRSPAPGGLELRCEAACGPGTAVHWIQAPGDLAAYTRWEAGAQAWLRVLWAGCHPEGWFQCRLDPGGQTASLYLLPEICEFGGQGRALGEARREEALHKDLRQGGAPTQPQFPQLSRRLP